VGHYREQILSSDSKLFIEVVLRVAAYMTASGQAVSALELLTSLPTFDSTAEQRYRLNLRLGNASMRVSGEVAKAETYFRAALELAKEVAPEEFARRNAEAHKELGYYFRNIGRWDDAEDAYKVASMAIARALPIKGSNNDREELASVYTNWAYVNALSGSYHQADSLIETALRMRRNLGRQRGLAISLSVSGEIHRYNRRFTSAWNAYEESRSIFQTLSDWDWLGVIYQEQAICLFQAAQVGFKLPIDDPIIEAKRLITMALDICRDQAPRHYPSALNRAGRIYGAVDINLGLSYLSDGVEQAADVDDGWFYFANLIEYVELLYRRWGHGGRFEDLDAIRARSEQIEQAVRDYAFRDLEGRWRVLNAYLDAEEFFRTGNSEFLDSALASVKRGFTLIATIFFGSHGAAALPHEFNRLGDIIRRLPEDVQEYWYEQLNEEWTGTAPGDAILLARLQELYIELASGI
jgi:tetratricopeptide (TPR) repeat protein